MKNLIKIALGVAMLALAGSGQQFTAPGRTNITVTITSGTPIEVTTNNKIVVDRLLVQMLKGGSGLGYICIVPYGTTPASKCSTSGQLAAQLAPASATAPGGSYSDTSSVSGTAGIELATVWIDGDNSGDVVLISANVR